MTVLAAVREAGPDLTRDELARIVEVWQRRLKLDHWSIRIDWDRPIDNAAEIKPWHVYDYATLCFNQTPEKGFHAWTVLIANRNVVHELLHLHLRDVDYAIETAELVMSAGVWKLFEQSVDNVCEAAIDRLATVLVDLAGVA